MPFAPLGLLLSSEFFLSFKIKLHVFKVLLDFFRVVHRVYLGKLENNPGMPDRPRLASRFRAWPFARFSS